MQPCLKSAAILLAAALLANATEPNPETARWWSYIKALASDKNEGRDTGSDGYRRAEEYVIKQFTRAGLKPAGTEGYRQPVPLQFVKLDTKNSSIEISSREKRSKLEWLQEVTLSSVRAGLPASITGELYFLGGDAKIRPADLQGKAVVVLSPPRFSGAGRSIQSQTLAQASAVVAIDTLGGPEPPRWPAAYAVSYRLAEDRQPASSNGPPHFRMNPESAGVLFAGSGHTLEELRSLRSAGKPLPNFALANSLSASLKFESGTVSSDNIAAALPGSDPALRDEYVVLSAHLDGYGKGEAWHGDGIYNGAFDDAAYVATLIDLAHKLKESHTQLKRSLLFCIVTGEEKGLLGSKYFAAHPTVAKTKMVADLNLDQLRPIFPLRTLTVLALNDSSLGADARQVADSMGIRVQPDPEPERGLLRRSDHYSFMQIGVPALNFVFGYQPGTGDEAIYRAWYAERYHSPADDTEQPWLPEAAAKFNAFYEALVKAVANSPQRPHWESHSKFNPAMASK